MKGSVWKTVTAIGTACMIAATLAAAFLGGCDTPVETAAGGTVPMKCHWAFVAATIVGIAGAVMAIASLIARSAEGRRFSSLGELLAALCCIAICSPLGIGVCAAAGHPCQTAQIVVIAASAIVVLLSIVQIVKADPSKAELPKMGL